MAALDEASGSTRRLFRGNADRLHSQIVRYFLAGTISFFCDLAILTALHLGTGMDLLAAGAVGYAVGVTVNYLIAIRWVFSDRSMGHRRGLEFVLYVLIGLSGLGLNELVLWGLAQELGLHFVFAKAVSGLVVLCWTFTIRRTLLFRKRRQIEQRYDLPHDSPNDLPHHLPHHLPNRGTGLGRHAVDSA